MKKYLFIVTALLSLPFSATSFAFPRDNPVPGGTVLIPLLPLSAEKPSAFYGHHKVTVAAFGNYWHAIVGLSLKTSTGKHQVQYSDAEQHNLKRVFEVHDKKYQTQHLTVTNKRKVNPTAEDLKRIKAERERKTKIKQVWTEAPPSIEFVWPVEGRISSVFGLRRFFNQQPRNPHSGLDIAAPEGTPVKAVADARVIDTGDFFFSGNMIFLDHGQGVITLYAHLHSISVKPGDIVKQGQIIGTVGETGRVTGPHLHLSVILNQATVDPLTWLPERQ